MRASSSVLSSILEPALLFLAVAVSTGSCSETTEPGHVRSNSSLLCGIAYDDYEQQEFTEDRILGKGGFGAVYQLGYSGSGQLDSYEARLLGPREKTIPVRIFQRLL
jgi:hypothetical protein